MTFIQKDQCVSKINCSFFNPQTSSQFPAITIKPISCLQNHRTIQWRIHRCLENTVFTRGFLGKISEGHNCKLWRITFSCKHVWSVWVCVIYDGKCNYYLLTNCIKHCFKQKFIQNCFKIFKFPLIYDKNLGFHAGLTGSKTPLDTFLQLGNNNTGLCLQIQKLELYLLRLRRNIHSNYFIAFTSTSKTRATVPPTLW